jgi:hypothetical protein
MLQTKKSRDLIFFAHRYLGLALGVLIAIAGLTGSIIIILNDTQGRCCISKNPCCVMKGFP